MEAVTDKRRIRYQDLKPYAFAASLDDLNGPSEGTVTLPQAIYWAPGSKTLSLDTPQRAVIYQAVLSEGSVDDICRFLDKGILMGLWPDLDLPIPVARGWEARFPELRGNMRASW